MITLIAAVASNGVIGTTDGKLPWKIPEEMEFFKQTTMGNVVVMGRRTYLSLKKPLINRTNIIVSSQIKSDSVPPGILVYSSLEDAISGAFAFGKEVFIIGGAVLYKTAIPLCNRMLISYLTFPAEGDVIFPAYNSQDYTEKIYKEFSLFTVKEYLRK